ncbi:MAG TPA: exosortase/archaeosortase family protein [Terriglobales bacterium]|nr:exosortase/archaeosortase family protein [Terriglobales bacterium]
MIFLLTALLYAPIAIPMVRQCWQDPNYTYGLFVPAFSLFLLWEKRRELAALPLKPAWSGLVIVLLALAALVVGMASSEYFLPRLSFLFLIVGMVVFLAGWRYLAAIAFPLAFLVLMVPSATLASELTFPLQIISSKIAALLLLLGGVPAVREGNVILLQAARLGVTEACSGIRFLFSLVTLAIIYGYLVDSRAGVRAVLALIAAPISIFANAGRIAVIGFIVQHWGIDRGEGALHVFSGWLVFLISLAALLAFQRLLVKFLPRQVPAPKQLACT